MEMELSCSCAGIDWEEVARILALVGMAHTAPELHQKAFEASYAVAFARFLGQLIGFGRAISDGVYQAALYDVAVLPAHQGKGVGSAIVTSLVANLPGCNVILYASPGKEAFYQPLGFRRMKTGMALFNRAELMAARGFTE